MKSSLSLLILNLQYDDDGDKDHDHDELLLLQFGWSYIQPEPLAEVLAIDNFWFVSSEYLIWFNSF